MSKIEAGKMEISLVSFEFEAMIRRVINVSAFRIDEKRQSFAVHIDKNIPRALIGDDQRLAQVITNLLSNAVKFTPEQGSISLDAEFAGESEGICTILIKVTDSGIGISPEQQSRLFGVFQQANSGTTRKFGGTGLGLAISQNIVEMMGGHISIKSELDKGSEFSFTVRLPRDEEAGVNAVEAATKTENKDLTGRRILLADDIEINREIVITLLEPFGIECDCAGDGTEAVRLFTESPDRYDLILMDMQMPEMDGCEATQHIRALAFPSAKTVPIVAMTANVFREDIDKCIKAGMNDHLAKPIDAATLVEKISRYTSPR
jgi:CheY-like chemotaxis protein